MKIKIEHPSVAWIYPSDDEMSLLNKQLTYTNTSEAHAVKRLYNNYWFKTRNPTQWAAAVEEAKRRVKRTLIYEGEFGNYIRPGSIPYLKVPYELESEIVYPKLTPVKWSKTLPFELYDYQKESVRKLIEAKHGNVELATGSGKSACILQLCHDMGLKTGIITPSKSIFGELLGKFEYHFDKKMIGTFGDGKKKLDKRFTVCIADSLCNIKRDTPEWEFFSNLDCMIVDESHTFGAETLEEICYGVLAEIPYRMFFSGTQTRNDGSEKLLQSIIGSTVHRLTTREAIEGGFICPHKYKIINIESSNPNFSSKDALEMKRAHFLKNRNICTFIAKFINTVTTQPIKQQVLVLVEELEQISMLVKQLKVPYAYAHSEKKADRLAELGLSKINPSEAVELFNRGRVNALIGTSAIATGTNIFPTNHTMNWVGGSSEIKTKQGAIGRSVRLGKHNPWADQCGPKDEAIIWDFNVFDVDIMSRHLDDRVSFYDESGTSIQFINLKG